MKPTKFITQAGEEITIRLATVEDAPELLAMKLEYLENSKTIPLFRSEYSSNLDKELQLISKLESEKNSVLFVAENNNKLIGNIDLNGNQRRKLFHTGVIGMGIREQWRGKGVGAALLDAVVKWCKDNIFINLLWLEAYDSNEAGKALYIKMGFNACGRIKSFFQEGNAFIDKITMVKHL